jgi:hypothetical protein
LLDDDALPGGSQQPKAGLGGFGANLSRRTSRRLLPPALLSAAVAALVGFSGYVISARAGLNEPPTTASVIDPQQLGTDARTLENSQNLSPHLFSRPAARPHGDRGPVPDSPR